MSIEMYKPDIHYSLLKTWVNLRGMDIVAPEFFPKIGFIDPNFGAGFLYMTDSVFGVLENLISNPESDKQARNEVLNKIIEKLVITAKSAHIKKLIVMSEIEAVKNRLIGLDFSPVFNNVTIFSKEI